jgi:hypothetical protein
MTMGNALVIYTAPEGDDMTVTMCGFDFVSGQPVVIDLAAINPAFVKVFRKNRYFEVVEEAESEPEPKRGPGRPAKVKADAENL